ncbi:MAG: hypothetical protein K9N49_00650 [Candidatus Marinimicrobia bacterium]|nr:hypothetical protein [Candidatus Neomarinimicrobiota bacterium]
MGIADAGGGGVGGADGAGGWRRVVESGGGCRAVRRLAAWSAGRGWCTAWRGKAKYYLEQADFHLLLVEGQAQVALRVVGKLIVEVEGCANRDPGEWWPRILLYANARALTIIHREAACRQAMGMMGQQLAGHTSPQGLDAALRRDPALVQYVADGMAGSPLLRPVVLAAWRRCIAADAACVGLAAAVFPGVFRGTQAWRPGWEAALQLEPTTIAQLPLDRQAELEDPVLAWSYAIEMEPLLYVGCPAGWREQAVVRAARIAGWVVCLKRNPTAYQRCPRNLKSLPEMVQAHREGWVLRLRNFPQDYVHCSRVLQRNPEIRAAWRQGWLGRLSLALVGVAWRKQGIAAQPDPIFWKGRTAFVSVIC